MDTDGRRAELLHFGGLIESARPARRIGTLVPHESQRRLTSAATWIGREGNGTEKTLLRGR
jgi:hypothetical protein